MAKVIRRFRDRNTNKIYEKGDSYSNNDEERVAFLIEKGYLKSNEAEMLKHTGGGWYELPNGEKIKGKDNALAALQESGD